MTTKKRLHIRSRKNARIRLPKKHREKKVKVKKVKKPLFHPTELLLIHDSEKNASKALRAIPKNIIQKTVGILTENFILIDNLANRIKISNEQLPEIYSRLEKIAEFLKIPVPKIYLEMNVIPKSTVNGIETPNIILTSALIEMLSLDEIETELAHCCGHIFLNHYYYQTIADAITKLGLGLVGSVLYYPFSYWKNCIEFSADRVAAIYCKSSEPVKQVLLKYAGITDKIRNVINEDLIFEQAEVIHHHSKSNEVFAKLSGKSPILRIFDLERWTKTEEFNEVISYFENDRQFPLEEFKIL